MSNFSQLTINPATKKYEMANWIDDHFGKHRYGVQFPDGTIYDPDKIMMITKEPTNKKKK